MVSRSFSSRPASATVSLNRAGSGDDAVSAQRRRTLVRLVFGLSAPVMASVAGFAAPALAAPPVPMSSKLPRADVPIPAARPMDLGAPVEEEDDLEAPEEEGPAAEAGGASAASPGTARPPIPPPAVSTEAVPDGKLPALCAGLVESKVIVAERAPPVPVQPGCGLPVPVSLSAVRLADGHLATFSPPALMRCETAVAVANWVREDIGPAIAALGTRLETVKVADSYQCRPRNRRKGAKISEHGQGNAFDTYGFVLADKSVLSVKGNQMPLDFQTSMKASACARFTTVLGPGSDGYHEDHIHVDLAVRRLDIRLCKWIIKAPTPAVVARADAKDEGVPTPAAAGSAPPEAPAVAGLPETVPLPPRRPANLGRRAPGG